MVEFEAAIHAEKPPDFRFLHEFWTPRPLPLPTPIILANIRCQAYYWSDKKSQKI